MHTIGHGGIVMRRYVFRHQPPTCRRFPFKAAIGAAIAMALCAAIAERMGGLLLMAPLAASTVLVFGAHQSPLSQPVNVVGGHMVAVVTALLLSQVLPQTWWAIGLGVGAALLLMAAFRLTHPPAGAGAAVVMATHPGITYLLFPALLGSLVLVLLAVVVHRVLPPHSRYPLPHPEH